MTKRIVRHEIDKDWRDAFQHKTKAEVLTWIAENVPDGYTFEHDWDYDYILYIEKTETDEEYAARLIRDAAEQARRKKAREDDILEQAKRITKERKNGNN